MTKSDPRFDSVIRRDAKTLSNAEGRLIDTERMVARQKALLAEVEAGSVFAVEMQRSLTRLEGACAVSRAELDALRVIGSTRVLDRAEGKSPVGEKASIPPRSHHQHPHWFRPSR